MENIRLDKKKKKTANQSLHSSVGLDFITNYEQPKLAVLLYNGGFGNSCITKRISYLEAFPSLENEYYSENDNIFYLHILS